jgi:hypothetical protein
VRHWISFDAGWQNCLVTVRYGSVSCALWRESTRNSRGGSGIQPTEFIFFCSSLWMFKIEDYFQPNRGTGVKPQLSHLKNESVDALKFISKELTWKVHFEKSQAEERAAEIAAQGTYTNAFSTF